MGCCGGAQSAADLTWLGLSGAVFIAGPHEFIRATRQRRHGPVRLRELHGHRWPERTLRRGGRTGPRLRCNGGEEGAGLLHLLFGARAIAPLAKKGLVQTGTVAQEPDVQVLEELKVTLPLLVMAALLHLVPADTAVLYRGIPVLDPGRKQEEGDPCWLTVRAVTVRTVAHGVPVEFSAESLETLATLSVGPREGMHGCCKASGSR
jgi:hypothetical protein